jgi:Stage II sporulation protein E (SpoIIE)
MNQGLEATRPAAPPRLRRAWRRLVGRALPRESRALRWLVLLVLVCATAIWVGAGNVPLTTLVLPMLFGSLFLGPRTLPWFVVFVLVTVIVVLTQQPQITAVTGGVLLVIFSAGFIILLTSFRRSRLGVGGSQGESMLVDLRDRIQGQGGIPVLPDGWHAQSALRSAGGTPFAGDFVVAARPHEGDRLEVAVVDVSGKGAGAGTRALLLSGALGGLIAALPPDDFLGAANDYLLQQNWDEGFATAIHMSLDLRTGDFEVRSAGHPPAAQRAAGSGRWSVHPSEGPALGLVADAEFSPVRGTVRSGDAVLLYTDGLVESRSRDIGLGIDKMLGQAEMLLRGSYEDGANRLIDQLGSRIDDRALLLIHRT